MNRNTILLLALASAFAAPMSAAYAEGDEDKKPESSQLIVAEGDEDKKPELVAATDESYPDQGTTPELIAEADGTYPDQGKTPELVAQSDEKQEAPKPELTA